jgi:hypothetical protein
MISTSAPCASAPFAASQTKVAVFQVERGLQLMATIFFMTLASISMFLHQQTFLLFYSPW